MSPSDQLRPAADAVTSLIAGVTPDQFDLPTPCSDWDVRALLNHLVGGGLMFGAAFAGQAPDGEGPGGDLIGSDPAAAWAGAVESVTTSLDLPAALDQVIPMPWGPTPGAIVLEILKFDVLVHAWDLARATGQAFDPPADTVEPVLETARMLLSPEIRSSGAFGAETTPPAGANAIDRLAAFTGRTVPV